MWSILIPCVRWVGRNIQEIRVLNIFNSIWLENVVKNSVDGLC